MVDFGFGLVPSSRINLDLFDKEKYDDKCHSHNDTSLQIPSVSLNI